MSGPSTCAVRCDVDPRLHRASISSWATSATTVLPPAAEWTLPPKDSLPSPPTASPPSLQAGPGAMLATVTASAVMPLPGLTAPRTERLAAGPVYAPGGVGTKAYASADETQWPGRSSNHSVRRSDTRKAASPAAKLFPSSRRTSPSYATRGSTRSSSVLTRTASENVAWCSGGPAVDSSERARAWKPGAALGRSHRQSLSRDGASFRGVASVSAPPKEHRSCVEASCAPSAPVGWGSTKSSTPPARGGSGSDSATSPKPGNAGALV